jgi:Holliday junction resolvase
MTEVELYERLRLNLATHGVAMRIENAVTPGLPDVIYVAHGRIIFIELKIRRGNFIHIPRHQWSYAKSIAPRIDKSMHWVAIGTGPGEPVMFHQFHEIGKAVEITPSNVTSRGMKCDMRLVKCPALMVNGMTSWCPPWMPAIRW